MAAVYVKNVSSEVQVLNDLEATAYSIASGEEVQILSTTDRWRRVYESDALASRVDAGKLQVRDDSGTIFKKAKYYRGWFLPAMVASLT